MNFAFQHLRSPLRRRADDTDVLNLTRTDPSEIDRTAYYAFIKFEDHGVELVFNEAPWVLPESEISDPRELRICAFHFYRQAHNGYSEYQEQFPGGAAFNDSESDIRRKLGQPLEVGGGGLSSVLKRPIPFWLRYEIDDALLHFQLDAEGRVEMVTLKVRAPGR